MFYVPPVPNKDIPYTRVNHNKYMVTDNAAYVSKSTQLVVPMRQTLYITASRKQDTSLARTLSAWTIVAVSGIEVPLYDAMYKYTHWHGLEGLILSMHVEVNPQN